MNRIVIIGNGFDLAHGQKTSYRDFIEWYWHGWLKKLYQFDESWQCSDQLCSFEVKAKNKSWKSYLYYNNALAEWNGGKPLHGLDLIYNLRLHNPACECKITSDLFRAICDEVERKNWVDIEEEYYRLLCEAKSVTEVKELNDDLKYIKEKLAEYLGQLDMSKYNDRIAEQIIIPFKRRDFALELNKEGQDSWKHFFYKRLHYQEKAIIDLNGSYRKTFDFFHHPAVLGKMKEYNTKIANNENIDFESEDYAIDEHILDCILYPEQILILNFNYTPIAQKYCIQSYHYSKRVRVLHIHGTVEDSKKMIFGYGDDNDEEYQVIKKKKQNEYLRNIKSINYLQSPEYRSLLSFIELGPYQVCTMGHSCGNSDGTLLNTLFEHDNCVYIKPYYHLWEDGTDDYFDIVGNISRNFTDPKKMRDRVVNKEFCESLPQSK